MAFKAIVYSLIHELEIYCNINLSNIMTAVNFILDMVLIYNLTSCLQSVYMYIFEEGMK